MVSTIRKRGWVIAALALAGLAPQPAWAHGAGVSTDAISTVLLVGAGFAAFGFARLRKRPATSPLRWALVPLAVVLLVGSFTVTSWGPKSKPSKIRPETAARLAIVEPAAGAVTGPDLALKLELRGGKIVPQSETQNREPDAGHIHTYLDGELVSMVDGLEQDVRGLEPGPHNLRAEFVAADHGPFKNRVVAAVLFQVAP